jgi:FAD-linked oxidoreductase
MNASSAIPSGSAWSNWSGHVTCTPAQRLTPTSIEALAEIVREAKAIRVVGSGHSFSEVVTTDATLLSLDAIAGLIAHDNAAHTANVLAGTRLYALGPMLAKVGQALPNMGDIDRQSIAGAVVTGTHGSGIGLGALAREVSAVKLMTADGSLLTISEKENAHMLQAARISLGWLGILCEVTLKNKPSFQIEEQTYVLSLDEFIQQAESLAKKHRHLDAHVFPVGKKVMVKTGDETSKPSTDYAPSDFMENTVLEAACNLTRKAPFLTKPIQQRLKTLVGSSARVGPSFGIYATPRSVRFNEMEYHVPAEDGPACLREVCEAIRQCGVHVFFPMEYRYVGGDEQWLSPFEGGPKASIAVHQYYKDDPWQLFRHVEPILQKYQGRPHWAKMHSMSPEMLAARYPKWNAFHQLREELDPTGKFENKYLRSLRLGSK